SNSSFTRDYARTSKPTEANDSDDRALRCHSSYSGTTETEFGTNTMIGQINPTTHAIAEFQIPGARALPVGSRRGLTKTSGSPNYPLTGSARSSYSRVSRESSR